MYPAGFLTWHFACDHAHVDVSWRLFSSMPCMGCGCDYSRLPRTALGIAVGVFFDGMCTCACAQYDDHINAGQWRTRVHVSMAIGLSRDCGHILIPLATRRGRRFWGTRMRTRTHACGPRVRLKRHGGTEPEQGKADCRQCHGRHYMYLSTPCT